MRILYLWPGTGPSGGLRVLTEHANRLQARGHQVEVWAHNAVKPDWIDLQVPLHELDVRADTSYHPFDVAIASNPDTIIDLSFHKIRATSYVYFHQMMEYIFWPQGTQAWRTAVGSFHRLREKHIKVITISEWGQRVLQDVFGVTATYIDNGVSRDHFYPDLVDNGDPYILIEGDNRNPAKDVDQLMWKVATRLKADFPWLSFKTMSGTPRIWGDDHIQKPTEAQYRNLYSNALFLLKASKYDFRSCAPMEAAACGTMTVRALIRGDDDLVDGFNCLRTTYNEDALYEAAYKMVEDDDTRNRLAGQAKAYIDQPRFDWGTVIGDLEDILCPL